MCLFFIRCNIESRAFCNLNFNCEVYNKTVAFLNLYIYLMVLFHLSSYIAPWNENLKKKVECNNLNFLIFYVFIEKKQGHVYFVPCRFTNYLIETSKLI